MTDWREELIEKMADAMFASDENGTLRVDVMARAALAVAEPVIREQADNVLRALLREARPRCDVPPGLDDDLCARIDAAIREGGKDA